LLAGSSALGTGDAGASVALSREHELLYGPTIGCGNATTGCRRVKGEPLITAKDGFGMWRIPQQQAKQMLFAAESTGLGVGSFLHHV